MIAQAVIVPPAWTTGYKRNVECSRSTDTTPSHMHPHTSKHLPTPQALVLPLQSQLAIASSSTFPRLPTRLLTPPHTFIHRRRWCRCCSLSWPLPPAALRRCVPRRRSWRCWQATVPQPPHCCPATRSSCTTCPRRCSSTTQVSEAAGGGRRTNSLFTFLGRGGRGA